MWEDGVRSASLQAIELRVARWNEHFVVTLERCRSAGQEGVPGVERRAGCRDTQRLWRSAVGRGGIGGQSVGARRICDGGLGERV